MKTIRKTTAVAASLLLTVRIWLAELGEWVLRKCPWLLPRTEAARSRADVPGWVLITLMSAVLVAGLLAIAGPALERLFNQAMEQVQP